MNKPYNDIVEARRMIFKQILDVQSEKISLEKAIILHKLNSDLMEAYRIQAKVYEIATLSSHTTVSIEDTTKLLK